MTEIYTEKYYKEYDVGIGKVDYADSVYTKDFLTNVAQHIVDTLHPTSVLDAGCAMGHLVAALRDRGVEAYGIDISQYAISKVREDIKPYCAVGSLVEPLPSNLPQRYDLVVTIEVLEHLYAEEGQTAIKNLCALSDNIIFSSTPDDFTERTHFNVQQREYWARIFASEGFFDNLNYRPTYLTTYAVYFKKNANWLRQLEDYERNIRMSEFEHMREISVLQDTINGSEQRYRELLAQRDAVLLRINDAEQEIQNQEQRLAENERHIQELSSAREEDITRWTAQIAQLETIIQQKKEENRKAREMFEQKLAQTEENSRQQLEQELAHFRTQYSVATAQRDELLQQLAQAENAYHVISNAFFWKITKPLRAMLDGIKSALRKNQYTHLMCRGLKCWKENGFSYTWNNIQDKLHHRQDFVHVAPFLFTKEELNQQRLAGHIFPRKIMFSVLVPLYNTPERFLHEMIRSVLDQTYENWELCLADGSDEQHCEVEKICRKYARRDSRIKYKKLRQNGGISENTNACIEMAGGDYFALLDHDDMLHPAALYEVMRAICEQDADFVYTDENTFHDRPTDAYCPHFKPDYSPDTLRSYNYICHLTAFSRELLRDAGGGFRAKFDGSQDYDLILRLTERATRIEHIPEILYYWRSHDSSTASDALAKPYVIGTAKKALEEHLVREGLSGEVLDSAIPSTYRIQYNIEGEPLVSILIPNKDHTNDLQKCIDSIRGKTTYPAWEIVIIENGSTDEETFDYYSTLKADIRIKIVSWDGGFNYSAINNFGAQFANGEHLILLNNDTEVITPDWIEQMLMFSQREDVGAVGSMLYYPDDTVQHAGVVVGLGRVAGHAHKHFPKGHPGYMYRMTLAQNFSAVTGACMMIRRDVWDKVDGLDKGFQVAFNDVDLCMRICQADYRIVWTPYAELYHYESKSRGVEDTPEKQQRFAGEIQRFEDRWGQQIVKGDPCYNPNLTLDREDFSLR